MNDVSAPHDPDGMSAVQRADLATLLSRYLLEGNIRWLGERILGEQGFLGVLAKQQPAESLATTLVEAMNEAGALGAAIATLKTEGTRSGRLMLGLNHVLSGYRLSELDAIQANVQAPDDPFLDDDFMKSSFPRAQRTVCAIGLGQGFNRLVGTGFLIAPDKVITNFHVVEAYLDVQSDDHITATVTGDNIYFFFDYLAGPRPSVPPDALRKHESVVVRAATNGWLVRARCRLPNEGTYPYATTAINKFDYAVIKLERALGNVPSRRGGGVLRGWLNLDSGVSYLDGVGTRIVVLQHPEGAEQLLDIGTYDRLDPSSTRIWYSVNTEKGASGGPAIDKQGRLYALHNATVLGQDGLPMKVNQGVRIDEIWADLRQVPGLVLDPPPVDGNPAYWSLSDNIQIPKPIIGRQFFRDSVLKAKESGGERVIAVTGPEGSGRRFSIALLGRILGGGATPPIRFGPTDLRTLSPQGFVQALANQLMPEDRAVPPEPKTTEPIARWLSIDLPTWLAQRLSASQAKYPSRYPAWIVIDTVATEGERLLWANNLPDLIAALLGVHDVGQTVVDLPQLRWLLLGPSLSFLPGIGVNRIVDDLTSNENVRYAADFADCMALAWRSKEAAEPISQKFLLQMGKMRMDEAIRQRKNVRVALADYVSSLLEAEPGGP